MKERERSTDDETAPLTPGVQVSRILDERYRLDEVVGEGGLPSLSRRVRSNLHQLMAEGHAFRGDGDRALAHIQAAADEALLDLDWLARCPLLELLRADPSFLAVQDRVRQRAEAIWRA